MAVTASLALTSQAGAALSSCLTGETVQCVLTLTNNGLSDATVNGVFPAMKYNNTNSTAVDALIGLPFYGVGADNTVPAGGTLKYRWSIVPQVPKGLSVTSTFSQSYDVSAQVLLTSGEIVTAGDAELEVSAFNPDALVVSGVAGQPLRAGAPYQAGTTETTATTVAYVRKSDGSLEVVTDLATFTGDAYLNAGNGAPAVTVAYASADPDAPAPSTPPIASTYATVVQTVAAYKGGDLRADGDGSAEVTVDAGSFPTVTLPVAVNSTVLQRIAITPPGPVNMAREFTSTGGNLYMTATGYYSDGTNANITSSCTWASSLSATMSGVLSYEAPFEKLVPASGTTFGPVSFVISASYQGVTAYLNVTLQSVGGS